MNNTELLVSALKEWTLNGQTIFLEGKETDEEVKKIVENAGFNYPDRNLAYFKTIYLECDKPNRNKMAITKTAAEKGLDSLSGVQINFDHKGRHFIAGFILKGKMEGNFVVAYGAIWKNAFKEEFQVIEKLFADRKLFVSFEIHRYNEKGKDILQEQSDGTYLISEVTYSGCGLLLKEKPACPKARVLDLLAKQELIDAEKIVDKIFKKELSSNIIYAEMFDDQCKKCAVCTCSKEEKRMKVEDIAALLAVDNEDSILASLETFEGSEEELEMVLTKEVEGEDFVDDEGKKIEAKKLTYQERKGLSDDDFAVVVKVKDKTIRMFPIMDEAHVRNALARLPQAAKTLKKLGISMETVKNKILKRAKELNMTELLKRHEKASEVTNASEKSAAVVPDITPVVTPEVNAQATPAERKLVKVITEDNNVRTESYTEGKSTVEGKGHTKITYKYSDGTENVEESDFENTRTYTQAQLDEKIATAKKEVIEAKDKEITDLKAGFDTEKKTLSDSISAKDQEIVTLKANAETVKTENETLKAEVTTLKAKKEIKDTKIKASVSNGDGEPEGDSITNVTHMLRDNILASQRKDDK